MKKKIVLISIITAIIVIASIYLYQTYATNSEQPNDSYAMTLTGNTTVNIPKYTFKDYIYQIKNTNDDTVQYGVGYSSTTGNSVVKVWGDSTDPATGTIGKNNYKYVKIRVENRTDTPDTVNISTVLGYENGGNLIPPTGVTIVTLPVVVDFPIISTPSNTTYFYLNNLTRANIESIEFKKLSEVPDNMTITDISKNNNGSVYLWYTNGETAGNFKVYIGSYSGKFKGDTSMASMFQNCSNLTTLDLSNLDTSNVESMYRMFMSCTKLESINFGDFDTSNVTNMTTMFVLCSNLKTLDLSSFDTSKVQTMNDMFNSCTALTEIKFSSKFNTENVTTMFRMFNKCSALKALDLSSFNTSKVTTMELMFGYCTNLKDIDLSSFDTHLVNNMNNMFYNCPSLITLDLSSFDTSAVTTMSNMFSDSTSLKTIYVSNLWTIASLSNQSDTVFYNCTSLVGQNGTAYVWNIQYATYAVIDNPPDSPGLLTYKAH